MKNSIRIALADDHQLMRDGIASLLNGVKDIEVVATVSSGEEAVNVANTSSLDVLLMDIIMKGMTGIEATRWIKEQNPQTKIILISSEVSKNYISDGIKVGIDGYLLKDASKEMLLNAIHSVMKGERFFSPEITTLVFQNFYVKEKRKPYSKKTSILSEREEEVLTHIASGKRLKEIGEELFISTKTVETHKTHIQDKLGLANTAQLVKWAIENKLI